MGEIGNRYLLTALVMAAALTPVGCQGCDDGKSAGIGPEHTAGAQKFACPSGYMPVHGSVRAAAKAGTWYPGDAAKLGAEVDGYLSAAADWSGPRPLALVSPHAGFRFSGPIAAQGYRTLRGQTVSRVYLIGPAHSGGVTGISVGTDSFYETPLGRVPVDRAVADELRSAAPFTSVPAAHRNEHSLEIQLPFLQRALQGSFSIVPLLAGQLSRDQVRQAAAKLRAIVGPDDLVVASSDFTHYGPNYGYQPFRKDVPARLEQLAKDAYAAIEKRDIDGWFAHKQKTDDTICGFYPVAILLALLPPDAKAELRQLDTSGHISGDYRNSVSYLSIVMTGSSYDGKPPPRAKGPPGCVPAPAGADLLDPRQQGVARTIAEKTVEQWVRKHTQFDPKKAKLPVGGLLSKHLGVFVTLKKDGKLRGCIGNIEPRGPLHEAIVGRAIDAAARDTRFSPVTPDELGDIEIEVSVLTVPTKIDGPQALVLGRDGVILSKSGRRAVFLPQVAPEQGWNIEQTLSHLAVKAGLGRDGWRQGAKLEAFQAQVF